jgi:sugar phosphate isomerase/epimerase
MVWNFQEGPLTLGIVPEEPRRERINYDPANLILYGKGNPVEALDVIGPYIRNIHVKDGFYPTDGDQLGRQVAVGQGKVDFPRLLAGLKKLGFQGEWIIEREAK